MCVKMKEKKGMMKKGDGLISSMLVYILIGLAVLIAMVVGYIVVTGKGIGFLNHIKNLFRFKG